MKFFKQFSNILVALSATMPASVFTATAAADVTYDFPAATTATSVCRDVPDGGCSICGEGKCVTKPDTIWSFPGQLPVPCGVLETAGYNGDIVLSQCFFLQFLASDVCSCADPTPPSGNASGGKSTTSFTSLF